MKTSIIIHGHFYQPPRENPYTGLVPIQSSAKPYSNWNEAIYDTCYKPNTASRYLNREGKIETMYNNYVNISSNFGQTLLDWADEAHPHFCTQLLKADKLSIQRFGHSSFMAQGFNHTILPLDSDSTKKIQVVWAIESYKQRFGHAPEGIWLAECAIDPKTVDILAQNNIRFVILAPWQGVAIDGVPRNGKPMPCDRPFLIEGPQGGRISAFFYDGEFASSISFGHMLRDADAMFARLCQVQKERSNPALITWATDGEIYGHHEPFGDMGLAAFLRKVSESKDFEIDNFASYLDKHPATEVATLGLGDDGKGTSWSCTHGVGRWERDCGCHTGGPDTWNQKWRGPLRKAFNNLETSAREIFDQKVREIFGENKDYEDLILAFSSVVSHKQTVQQFIQSLEKADGSSLSYAEGMTIASMLEAFKNVMFAYTSCGFFFNDLSGIEPRQNIVYAMYAADILDQFSDLNVTKKLLEDLDKAKSNIPTEGTGADLAKKDTPKGSNYANACAYFVLNRRFANPEDYIDHWGFFKLLELDETTAKIQNSRTLKIYDLTYESNPKANGGMEFVIRDINTAMVAKINVGHASEKTLQTITSWVEDRLTENMSEKFIDSLAENIGTYLMLIATNRSLAKDTIFMENIGTCIKSIKSLVLDQPQMDIDKKINRIKQLCFFVMIKGRNMDIQDINDAFSRKFEQKAVEFIYKMDEKSCWETLMLLRAAREEGLNPDITNLQNTIYQYIHSDDSPISEELRKALRSELNFS